VVDNGPGNREKNVVPLREVRVDMRVLGSEEVAIRSESYQREVRVKRQHSALERLVGRLQRLELV